MSFHAGDLARILPGRPIHTGVWPCIAAALGLCLVASGCADPATEMSQVRRQFEQIPPRADRGMIAFVLGLPTAETQDRSAWLYFTPPPGPLEPARPQRLIVVRFDKADLCVCRELLIWRQPKQSQIDLHYELSWTDPQRLTESDFWSILRERLEELARANGVYHLDTQPASYQLRVEQTLLVGMQRWQQDRSRLVRLSATVLDDDHPRLTEAIEVSCRVRVLSAGIEFNQPLMQGLR
jgi:hypothetical protein